jgi:hypothetical protein
MRWIGARLLRVAAWGEPLGRGWRWLPAAVAVGAIPVAASYLFNVPGHGLVTAVALWLLFLACVREGAAAKGLSVVAVAFATHSIVAIALAELDPSPLSRIFAGGEEYWQRQVTWITTGRDPEYDWHVWVPAHAILLGAVLGLSMSSIGLATFCYGFAQVDLMNVYCGRLIAHSQSAAVAVACGWHPWSVARGLGCLLIVWNVSEWTMAKAAGLERARSRWRAWRWAGAAAFVVADGVMKCLLMEAVRGELASGFRP